MSSIAPSPHVACPPDESVNWSLVQHTRLLTDAPVKCPLCLGETNCPRITECGHVCVFSRIYYVRFLLCLFSCRYCTLCLLQMFSANAKHKVPCPICLVPFIMSSTKPIAIAISSTNAAVVSRSCASDAAAATTSATNDTVGRVSFAMLQRWRGNNSPVLVSHSIAAQQVKPQHIIAKHTCLVGLKTEPCSFRHLHFCIRSPVYVICMHMLSIPIPGFDYRVNRQVHAPFSKFLVSCHNDASWAKLEAKEQGQLLLELLIDQETSDADLVKRYDLITILCFAVAVDSPLNL
jgi:hypothetical protein